MNDLLTGIGFVKDELAAHASALQAGGREAVHE
jgi:hypothetical protein